MMNEKEKLASLREGLEIVKKYDEKGEMNFADYILKNDADELKRPLSADEFNEMVHNTVTSYTNIPKKIKK